MAKRSPGSHDAKAAESYNLGYRTGHRAGQEETRQAIDAWARSWDDARFSKSGRESEWTRHMLRSLRKALPIEGEASEAADGTEARGGPNHPMTQLPSAATSPEPCPICGPIPPGDHPAARAKDKPEPPRCSVTECGKPRAPGRLWCVRHAHMEEVVPSPEGPKRVCSEKE